jgi:hypothetical protein
VFNVCLLALLAAPPDAAPAVLKAEVWRDVAPGRPGRPVVTGMIVGVNLPPGLSPLSVTLHRADGRKWSSPLKLLYRSADPKTGERHYATETGPAWRVDAEVEVVVTCRAGLGVRRLPPVKVKIGCTF